MSAQAALQSEQNALNSANSSQQSAINSSNSASAALQSEQNAAQSEQNAAQSASDALQSEQNASQSAQDALQAKDYLENKLFHYISDDEISVKVGIGTQVLVSESVTGYPSVILQLSTT